MKRETAAEFINEHTQTQTIGHLTEISRDIKTRMYYLNEISKRVAAITDKVKAIKPEDWETSRHRIVKDLETITSFVKDTEAL